MLLDQTIRMHYNAPKHPVPGSTLSQEDRCQVAYQLHTSHEVAAPHLNVKMPRLPKYCKNSKAGRPIEISATNLSPFLQVPAPKQRWAIRPDVGVRGGPFVCVRVRKVRQRECRISQHIILLEFLCLLLGCPCVWIQCQDRPQSHNVRPL